LNIESYIIRSQVENVSCSMDEKPMIVRWYKDEELILSKN